MLLFLFVDFLFTIQGIRDSHIFERLGIRIWRILIKFYLFRSCVFNATHILGIKS